MKRQNVQLNTDADAAVEDFWLPTGRGSVAATWFWPEREIDPEAMGVVVVPGIIHEEQTMAVGLVALAHELSARGMPTLLIDLAGTAQGSGTLAATDIGARWDDDVRAAVKHLRDTGLRHVAVVGVRLGALVAAHALVDDPVDVLAMWAPVLSGRRFVRELQIMQGSATDSVGDTAPGITVGGFNIPPDLVTYLKTLDAAKLHGKPAGQLCIIDTADRLAAVDEDHPMFTAVRVERVEAPQTEMWLFTAPDTFPAPFDDLHRVVRHVEAHGTQMAAPPGSDLLSEPIRPDVSAWHTHVVEHDGHEIRETFVEFGSEVFADGGRLTGILSEPAHGADPAKAYVAVTTVGPGRIFVDFARREATHGRACLRFNLAGFGSSSRRAGKGWADFYDSEAPAEIGAAVDLLGEHGFHSVHVVGFCAGAWAAVKMQPRPEVAGIIGINPQMMIRLRLPHRRVWPGLTSRNLLLARLGQDPRAKRILEGVETRLPVPSGAIRAIGRQVDAGTDVTMIFDDVDGGYDYLRKMMTRPFGARSTRPTLRAYAGLGHLPAGPARDRMLADIHDRT